MFIWYGFKNAVNAIYLRFRKTQKQELEMADEDEIITKAKLEIDGVWYETHIETKEDGCKKCDLRKRCDKNANLYELCTHLNFYMYFKKADKKSLEEARFFHG